MEEEAVARGKDVKKGGVVLYLLLLTAKVNVVKEDMAALCSLTLASVLTHSDNKRVYGRFAHPNAWQSLALRIPANRCPKYQSLQSKNLLRFIAI